MSEQVGIMRRFDWKSFWGMFLVAIAPSVGVLATQFFQGSNFGPLVWVFSKAWLFGLPVLWHLKVDKAKLSWSKPELGGWTIGIVSGVLILVAILGVYFLARDQINAKVPDLRAALENFKLDARWKYILGALYWILINSVLEEYVFRWFIFRKCEALMGGAWAVVAAGIIFVVHHTIAMSAFLPAGLNALASFGIFIGGAMWSWMYLKYRSIWIGYISHAFADIAIFGLGWYLVYVL